MITIFLKGVKRPPVISSESCCCNSEIWLWVLKYIYLAHPTPPTHGKLHTRLICVEAENSECKNNRQVLVASSWKPESWRLPASFIGWVIIAYNLSHWVCIMSHTLFTFLDLYPAFPWLQDHTQGSLQQNKNNTKVNQKTALERI